LLAISLLAAVVLSWPGCAYDQNGTVAADEEPQDTSGENTEDPPPPKTGNPKLRLGLNQLIAAHERGEAEEWARSHGIDLIDGSVRVSIECVSGQLEAAVKAVTRLGTVEVIAERSEQIQALIPIASLTALAREGSISSIRVPIKGKTTSDG